MFRKIMSTQNAKPEVKKSGSDMALVALAVILALAGVMTRNLRKAGICMGNFFYDVFNGKKGYTISDSMAVDEDGDLLMRLSDHTVMDMDTGEIGFLSSAGNLFDEEDDW